jgi:DNA-binding PadR family transcriptional regulator
MSDRENKMANKLLEQLLGTEADGLPSLSAKEAAILQLLVLGKEMYGLQIVAESNGVIGRGTVYVTLARMEEKGFIDSRQEAQAEGATGLPRRLYRVTGEGTRVLRAWERAAQVLRAKAVRT